MPPPPEFAPDDRYPGLFPSGHVHPSLQFTHLGQQLRRHAVGGHPDIGPLSASFLNSGYDYHDPNDPPDPDWDSLALLQQLGWEEYQHPLSWFNWDRVPRGLAMDRDLYHSMMGNYGYPLPNDWTAVEEMLQGRRSPRPGSVPTRVVDELVQTTPRGQYPGGTQDILGEMARSATRVNRQRGRNERWWKAPRGQALRTAEDIWGGVRGELQGTGDPEWYAACNARPGRRRRLPEIEPEIEPEVPTPYDPLDYDGGVGMDGYDPSGGAYNPAPPYMPQYQPGSGFSPQPVYPPNAYPGQPGTADSSGMGMPTGEATQPPFGGASYPAPDGWGHTDPLGHPYARYENGPDDDGDGDDNDDDDTDVFAPGEGDDVVADLIGVLNKALEILTPYCGYACR